MSRSGWTWPDPHPGPGRGRDSRSREHFEERRHESREGDGYGRSRGRVEGDGWSNGQGDRHRWDSREAGSHWRNRDDDRYSRAPAGAVPRRQDSRDGYGRVSGRTQSWAHDEWDDDDLDYERHAGRVRAASPYMRSGRDDGARHSMQHPGSRLQEDSRERVDRGGHPGRSRERRHSSFERQDGGYDDQDHWDDRGRDRSRSCRARQGDRGEERDGECVEYLQLPRSVAGRIIGKNGATIKEIRVESRAQVEVQDLDGTRCEFEISGSLESVRSAKRHILSIADDASRDGDVEKTLEFPRSDAGRIIGTRGLQIGEIRKRSRADVQLKEFESHCEVRIIGTAEQVKLARTLVEEVVFQPRPKGQKRSLPDQPRSAPELEKSIEVPVEVTGLLIGKGGERVHGLEHESGAHIDITPKEDFSVLRFSGSEKAIKHAEQLVSAILERAEEDARRSGRSAGASADMKVDEKMSVPEKSIGRIIGKGGETIQQLQRDSGVKIDVIKDNPSANVHLHGRSRNIERAKQLIMDLLDRSEPDVLPVENADAGKVEDSMTVPPAKVGKIIGRGGETIMQLQQESGARLRVDKNESAIRLSGSADAVAAAKQLIQEVIDHVDEEREEKTRDAMEVPPAMVGRIIGKRGETIMQLQKEAGCKIQISKGDNLIRMVGTEAAVAQARQLITEVMERAETQQAQEAEQPGKRDEKIEVPESMMGRIIGKGGEKIMELQRKTGAKIDVKRQLPGIVRIIGASEAVEYAKLLVSEVIEDAEKEGNPAADEQEEDELPAEKSVEISSAVVENVVGDDGEKLKKLEEEVKAQITVSTADDVVTLNIRGSSKSVKQAQKRIFETIRQGSTEATGAAASADAVIPAHEPKWRDDNAGNQQWHAEHGGRPGVWNAANCHSFGAASELSEIDMSEL
eukprot:TRINITY_DN38195_c0_g1_i1.p1 TRINITY_DN38195_c0_g1~~TRINITY_DN38195_c0_g1_i1.p1  ORF type:complete len:913 (+),score=214.25 TRINITY_DN38195_c0_g1_i1:37-2775(+)